MNRKRYISLTESDKDSLLLVQKTSNNHRERQRASSLLLSSSGKDMSYLSGLFGVKHETISSWFNRWELGKGTNSGSNEVSSLGISLRDAARSGRPSILTEPEKKSS